MQEDCKMPSVDISVSVLSNLNVSIPYNDQLAYFFYISCCIFNSLWYFSKMPLKVAAKTTSATTQKKQENRNTTSGMLIQKII